MNGERLDELQGDAQHLLFTTDSEYIKDFAARVIELCEAYGRARTALEAVTKENTQLKNANNLIAAVIEAALITPRDAVWNAEWMVEHHNMMLETIYQQSQKIAALEVENARLKNANYDLLSLRHGSLSPRVSKVVPQESE
jgi:uncharacterized membrane protein YjgN (DUF898 family)